MTKPTARFWQKKAFVSYVLSVLVFWIHISSFDNYSDLPGWVEGMQLYFQWVITPIGVPTFFVIAGALFFRNYSTRDYPRKLKGRIFSLMIPYVMWNTLNMLFEMFATVFLSQYFVGRRPFLFHMDHILRGMYSYLYNGPFWFVHTLIELVLLAPLWDLLMRNKYVGVASILSLAIITHWPVRDDWIYTCLVYFLCGGMIARYCWDWFCKPASRRTQLICGAILVAANIIRYYGFSHDVGLIAPVKALWYVAEGLCLWFFSDLFFSVDRPHSPAFLEHSFFIYAMHTNVSAVFAKLVCFITGDRGVLAPVNFLLTTILTLLSIEICCIILKKWFRPFYNLLSGNRS